MQEILQSPEKPNTWAHCRKPFWNVSGWENEKIQQVLHCHTITGSFAVILTWLLTFSDKRVKEIARLFSMPTSITIDISGRSLTVLDWAVECRCFELIHQLLPLCEQEHIPSGLMVSALAHSHCGIAELLLFHGVTLPTGIEPRIKGKPVDPRHPSIARSSTLRQLGTLVIASNSLGGSGSASSGPCCSAGYAMPQQLQPQTQELLDWAICRGPWLKSSFPA
ncbi:hypothetical protein Pelo_16550 [Pelomyxa schiedti]|nr:hypothetical protein Pelo_16550 [Pelomyxa schiedti]